MLWTLDISESGAEYASDAAEYFDTNLSGILNGNFQIDLHKFLLISF